MALGKSCALPEPQHAHLPPKEKDDIDSHREKGAVKIKG